MKKILLSVALAFAGFGLMAQPISKKGEPYLPEAGDWAVGIDATPFFKYLGNFFSDTENAAPDVTYENNAFAIQLKYFKTEDFAYRIGGRLNIYSQSQRAFSPEFSTEPTNTTVEDKYTRTFTNFYASLGIEKRRGTTRVQGFYGVEGILGFGTEGHKFDYGNKITQQNTNPDRTEYMLDFQDGSEDVSNITEVGGYITEYKMGTMFSIGARAFVGAEVFIFPKWSVGFELGLSAAFAYRGNTQITSEQWTIPTGGTAEQYVTTVSDQGGSSAFRLDNDNSGGALFMTFYF